MQTFEAMKAEGDSRGDELGLEGQGVLICVSGLFDGLINGFLSLPPSLTQREERKYSEQNPIQPPFSQSISIDFLPPFILHVRHRQRNNVNVHLRRSEIRQS